MRRRAFCVLALAGCVPGSTTAPPPRTDAEPDEAEDDPPVAQAAPTADALDGRVAALEQAYGRKGFTVLREDPWVVIGDGPRWSVRTHAEDTVAWATRRLKEAYFSSDPSGIVEIWLFRDHASYVKHARSIFGDEPDTPYGYYTHEHDALVMNIETGGGTLVHELVHPLMRANFPACPSWFDEGLASLYEQCGEREGEIVGFTNWRLPGLQESVAEGTVPPFSELCATGDRPFYDEDPGTNYAQARYLCYWLQEHGKLREYFGRFLADASRDPSGVETLRTVIGRPLPEFKRDWEQWVLGLRYG